MDDYIVCPGCGNLVCHFCSCKGGTRLHKCNNCKEFIGLEHPICDDCSRIIHEKNIINERTRSRCPVENIDEYMTKWVQARKSKDYVTVDYLTKQLGDLGVTVTNTKQGPKLTWDRLVGYAIWR